MIRITVIHSLKEMIILIAIISIEITIKNLNSKRIGKWQTSGIKNKRK